MASHEKRNSETLVVAMVRNSRSVRYHMTHTLTRMDGKRLDLLVRRIGTDVSGGQGYWQFDHGTMRLECFSDPSGDRMGVMVPVAAMKDVTPDQLTECMEANFDRSMDARYCIFDGVLCSVFLHQLSSLTPSLFRSGCRQVVLTAKNFGRSYSSSESCATRSHTASF